MMRLRIWKYILKVLPTTSAESCYLSFSNVMRRLSDLTSDTLDVTLLHFAHILDACDTFLTQ